MWSNLDQKGNIWKDPEDLMDLNCEKSGRETIGHSSVLSSLSPSLLHLFLLQSLVSSFLLPEDSLPSLTYDE